MGKSPQERAAAHQLAADDPTIEIDVLEQTISMDGARALRHDALGLTDAPIPADWILEGNPLARSRRLAGTEDQQAEAFMWDFTAGRFNWVYAEDEITHVLEGSVIIEDASGVRKTLQAGDTFVFPAGSRHQWTVPGYVRKIAFLRRPLPPELRLVTRLLERATAPFRRKPDSSEV
jgi:uncharacterized cupin superfamily protein